MNTIEIVKDALKYPITDWKKLLILGVIIVISGIGFTAQSLNVKNMDIMVLFAVIGFLIGFLVNGYMYKIITKSLNGKKELPEFKNWIDIGTDGVKVFLVFIIYLIPVILVILSLFILSFEINSLNFEYILGLNLFDLLIGSLDSIIISGIYTLFSWLSFLFLPEGIMLSLFGILYIFIVIPVLMVAIANMAYYEGELKSAFRIREIIEEISLIGWNKLIKWYIVTGIIFLVIEFILFVISYISFVINLNTILDFIIWKLLTLTLVSYSYIFIARSVALFYMPDKDQDIIEESISQGKFIKDYQ